MGKERTHRRVTTTLIVRFSAPPWPFAEDKYIFLAWFPAFNGQYWERCYISSNYYGKLEVV